MRWYEVDKEGLAKILQRRGITFALWELVSNALDAPGVTRVVVQLEPLAGVPYTTVVVEDDSPEGFTNLSHAWTLYAESTRKGDAEKRGRFNLGEKLVLALCRQACITTTTGTVRFDEDGRHNGKGRRERGSEFRAEIRMTRDEMLAAIKELRTLLSPAGVTVEVNGLVIGRREPVAVVEDTLATEIAGEDGIIRRSARKTKVEIVELRPGEVAQLYELGIPVVATEDTFSVNVLQKVPLNMDRDNVPPAFLRHVRTLILNTMKDTLSADDAASPWVRDACESPLADPTAVLAMVKQRFGEKFVGYDPQDREANGTAGTRGYTVIPPSALSKQERNHLRAAGAWHSAGQVFPTQSGSQGCKDIPESKWTDGMRAVVRYAQMLGRHLLDKGIRVSMFDSSGTAINVLAQYGKGHLSLNVHLLGPEWFERGINCEVTDLLLHELAHEYESDHRSHEYHAACTRLGAHLAHFFASNPGVCSIFDVLPPGGEERDPDSTRQP